MAQLLRAAPTLCWAILARRGGASWADSAAMVLYVALAGLELGVILAAVPLWCVLPGAVFALWAAACAAVVAAMCWMLNGKEQMYRCDAGSEGWMMGQEVEDEKWMFLGGMGMRCVSLTQAGFTHCSV
jgi:hypothetical protein